MAKLQLEDLDRNALSEHFAEMLRAQERRIADSTEGLDGVRRVWDARAGFTEKLLLLNTGTFVLTLSFMGSLGSHAATKSISHFFLPTVYTAWGFLLAAIICGGVHNLFIIHALEKLFIATGSIKREYRARDQARWISKTFTILTGKIVPDEGEELEEINLSEAGPILTQAAQAECNKVVKDAQGLSEKSIGEAKELAGTALRFGSYSLITTLAALILLTIAAWQSAWVLLQK